VIALPAPCLILSVTFSIVASRTCFEPSQSFLIASLIPKSNFPAVGRFDVALSNVPDNAALASGIFPLNASDIPKSAVPVGFCCSIAEPNTFPAPLTCAGNDLFSCIRVFCISGLIMGDACCCCVCSPNTCPLCSCFGCSGCEYCGWV